MPDRQTRVKETIDRTTDRAALITREQLIALLREDLARAYQAVIANVVYSRIIKGASYMTMAQELEKHAKEELEHALILAKYIDHLGGTPSIAPKAVRLADTPEELLHLDLANNIESVRSYRERVRQCEALGEYALAQQLRAVLVDKQEHLIDLSTALGISVAELVPN